MISLISIILLSVIYCFLFNFIPLSPWFNFLWAFISILFAIGSYLLFILIFVKTAKNSKPTGKIRYKIVRDITKLIFIFSNVKIKYIGLENVPNEPFVCYPNHRSNMDVFLVHYGLNRVCSAVGKNSLFKYPIIKDCQQVFGCISLDRENDRAAAKSMIEAIKNIKSGLSYILFPEGTRNKTEETLLPFRDGAFKLLTKTNAILLPCTIIGSDGFSKRKSILKRVKVKVIYHQGLTSEDYNDLNTATISSNVMEIIKKDII